MMRKKEGEKKTFGYLRKNDTWLVPLCGGLYRMGLRGTAEMWWRRGRGVETPSAVCWTALDKWAIYCGNKRKEENVIIVWQKFRYPRFSIVVIQIFKIITNKNFWIADYIWHKYTWQHRIIKLERKKQMLKDTTARLRFESLPNETFSI